MPYKLDTNTHVYFYEQEFYVLSNFSSFKVLLSNIMFDTSEQAYHWFKFPDYPDVQQEILNARSAHDAFHIAQVNKQYRRSDWDDVKVKIMKQILLAKIQQHHYVYKKLQETNNRMLVEDSWRDDYWGHGPNKDGKNMLGVLWMEIRSELF